MTVYRWLWSTVLAAGFGLAQFGPGDIHLANSENCLEGFSGCEYSHLDLQQKQSVQRAKEQRNFMDCFRGFFDCDAKQLNPAQQREIARENRDRNFQNCIDGIGECDQTLHGWQRPATCRALLTESEIATKHNLVRTNRSRLQTAIMTETWRIALKA